LNDKYREEGVTAGAIGYYRGMPEQENPWGQAAIDGENVILLKPDGKELKAKIIKRERAH
jgi:hypothetical protein